MKKLIDKLFKKKYKVTEVNNKQIEIHLPQDVTVGTTIQSKDRSFLYISTWVDKKNMSHAEALFLLERGYIKRIVEKSEEEKITKWQAVE